MSNTSLGTPGDIAEILSFRHPQNQANVRRRSAVQAFTIFRDFLTSSFKTFVSADFECDQPVGACKIAAIEVALEYGVHELRVLARDDGHGIDPQVLHSGREGHWGLSGMRERAERIGAKLRVWSGGTGGTEVDLRVPGRIAFDSQTSGNLASWLSKMYMRKKDPTQSERERRVG